MLQSKMTDKTGSFPTGGTSSEFYSPKFVVKSELRPEDSIKP